MANLPKRERFMSWKNKTSRRLKFGERSGERTQNSKW
jgi:hypothetical protein